MQSHGKLITKAEIGIRSNIETWQRWKNWKWEEEQLHDHFSSKSVRNCISKGVGMIENRVSKAMGSYKDIIKSSCISKIAQIEKNKTCRMNGERNLK